MKKIILGVAVMSFVIGCQKVQPGSNKGVLRMTEGVERYNDLEMTDEASAKLEALQASKVVPTDSTKVSTQALPVMKTDSAMEVKSSAAPAATEKK